MRSEKIRRALVLLALPLGVYVLAALIITWPLAARITTHAAGAGWGDSFEVIRHGWWAREALLDGHNPFDQPLLAYPDGFTSWLMASHPLQYLPPALLALVFSPLVAFNLALLSVLVLNGLSAYWLGLHLNGGRRLGALLGGLVFLAFPAVQGHLSVGHLGIVTLWPVPLFTLALWRVLFERAGWRSVIAGGVWFALAALAYVSQITFVLLPLIGLIGVGALLWARRQIVVPGAAWAEQPWLRVLALIALGGLLLVPFYAPLLSDAGRAEVRGIAEPGRVAFSADVLAPVSVSPFGPLDALAPDYTRDVLGVNSAEGSAYLGVIALALAAIAIWHRRTTARTWVLIGLGALVLSLGPLLKWRDEPVIIRFEAYESYVPLPWALLQEFPLLDATRTPGRFNLATGLALSALVSIGAAAALERVRRREAALALAVGLGGLVLVEYQLFWPFLTTDARQPAYFRDLARQDDVSAVLNLPANHNLAAKFALYQQTIHGKPLIAGHALRRTPQNPALLALLEQVAGADAAGGVFTLTPETARYLLSAAGADRVIVHKPFMPDAANALDHVRAVLGAPDYEDEQIAAFVVSRTGDPPPDLALAGAGGSEGWSVPVDAGPFAGRFLADDGAWHFYSADVQYGELVFRALPYRVARRIGFWLDDHLIAGTWIAGEAIRLPLWLEPGYHTLRLQALDGCTAYPFALTCWESAELSADCAPGEPPACISAVFEAPEWVPAGHAPQPVEAALDEGLRLRAVDLRLDADARAVDLRLFWAAEDSLPGSYALFVHVADPATDEPLAQIDAFPLVLTDAWGADSRWQSAVRVPLPDDLAAGTYAVNVGWFRPEDGARLGLVRVGAITLEG